MSEAVRQRQKTRGWLEVAVKILVIAGLCTGPVFPAFAADSDARRDLHAQVVGGEPVPQGKYPFMAYVQIETSVGFFSCGGTLIDPRFVLLAAHCTSDSTEILSPEAFEVITGSADLNEAGAANFFAVSTVSVHPLWNPLSNAYDVAVLELATPVPSKLARPIAIVGAGVGEFDQSGQAALVAGWGYIQSGGPPVDRLRAATLGIVDDDSCAGAYGDEFFAAAMICASAPGKDSCQGDSGGPLFVKDKIGTKKERVQVKARHNSGQHGKHEKFRKRTKRVPVFNNVQIGIVSFGAGCAEPGFPGVYTQLSDPAVNAFVTGVVFG